MNVRQPRHPQPPPEPRNVPVLLRRPYFARHLTHLHHCATTKILYAERTRLPASAPTFASHAERFITLNAVQASSLALSLSTGILDAGDNP